MTSVASVPIHRVELHFAHFFDAQNRMQAATVLTFLLILLHAHQYWYINLPLSILALSGLIFPDLGRSRVVWTAILGIIVIGSIENWYALDNHKYLLAYWSLAITCSLVSSEPDQVLAVSARRLIALVFLVAVIQKIISGEFLDGSFMHFELLHDPRFDLVARHLGALPTEHVEFNRTARAALTSFDSQLAWVALETTPRMASVASLMSLWTIAVEGLVMAAFGLPRWSWLHARRDLCLLGFLGSTYLLAPVIGFGWVLAIMGLAQTDACRRRTRIAYVTMFLVLQAYRIPWHEIPWLLAADGPS